MQSFLQYRKIRLAVRKQIEIHNEKAEFSSGPQQLSDVTAPDSIMRSDSSSTASAIEDAPQEEIRRTATVQTQHTAGTALGHALAGIHARERTTREENGGKVFIVEWEGERDPLNPQNWSVAYRLFVSMIVGSIAFIVGAASSADTAILPQAAAHFGVSDVVESLSIGLYLIGYSVGAIFAGPFSETFGRNAVYMFTMLVFMIFMMASALAPNIGAQLSFRFLAGAFGATPLTCAGGSISDMWSTREKTFAFPVFAIIGFPVLGPVIGSYVIYIDGSWRWSEWIILIGSGIVLGLIVLLQPETFPPLLLKWKAEHLRHETGDDRFRAKLWIVKTSIWSRLKVALIRPVRLALEPIVMLMTLYMTVLYIVFFTFLDGYWHIFQDVYGISQSFTNIIFVGMFVGVVLGGLPVPWVYKITSQSLANNTFVPESRLWFAMLGAPAVPISLFWMGWTCYASISIWSPILASVLLGYGTICIFNSAYMYLIDSYEIYAASALTFLTITRYSVAGGMTVVGVPFYNNLGPHWTLTILGGITVLMTPIPYAFYRYGYLIRGRSKYAVIH